MRAVLLASGTAVPIVYALADALAGMRWDGYSFRDQTISELAASGAPTRALFSALLVPAYLLLCAFGVGVWQAGRGRTGLRRAGSWIVALGVMAVAVGPFVPMPPRGSPQGLSGLLHLVEGGVAVAMIVAAITFAAISLGNRFRWYSFATLAVVLVFGAWAGMDVPGVEAGSATPYLGVKERIFWYTYEAWFAALALALLRGARRSDGGRIR